MSFPRKVTDAERDAIVRAYLIEGLEPAADMAAAAGVSRRYVARLLRQRGIKNTSPKGRASGNYPTASRDPRWNWAVERGGVSL